MTFLQSLSLITNLNSPQQCVHSHLQQHKLASIFCNICQIDKGKILLCLVLICILRLVEMLNVFMFTNHLHFFVCEFYFYGCTQVYQDNL